LSFDQPLAGWPTTDAVLVVPHSSLEYLPPAPITFGPIQPLEPVIVMQ